MSDASHWNNVAATYDTEIFNVYSNDKKKKLKKYISKYASLKSTAIDFGCGVGKALPLLTPYFKEVIGIDVSKKCIDIARTAPFKNVSFEVADLAAAKINVPSVNFAFCCNVAINGDLKRNYRIISNVLGSLNKRGVALLILPSLESVFTAAVSLMRWYEKEGHNLAILPENHLKNFRGETYKELAEGIVNVQGVPTKHYLLTELHALFNNGNFKLQNLDRLEYSWKTEYTSPPKWMNAPYPWDWVAEVKRVK